PRPGHPARGRRPAARPRALASGPAPRPRSAPSTERPSRSTAYAVSSGKLSFHTGVGPESLRVAPAGSTRGTLFHHRAPAIALLGREVPLDARVQAVAHLREVRARSLDLTANRLRLFRREVEHAREVRNDDPRRRLARRPAPLDAHAALAPALARLERVVREQHAAGEAERHADAECGNHGHDHGDARHRITAPLSAPGSGEAASDSSPRPKLPSSSSSALTRVAPSGRARSVVAIQVFPAHAQTRSSATDVANVTGRPSQRTHAGSRSRVASRSRTRASVPGAGSARRSAASLSQRGSSFPSRRRSSRSFIVPTSSFPIPQLVAQRR